MEAIKKYSGGLSPAILAVNAGNDVLLTSEYYTHVKAVIEAVKNGTISEDTINTACRRIIAWKLKYIKDEPKKSYTLIIILSVAGGVIVLGIIGFILYKCVFSKRKQNGGELLGSVRDSHE